MKRNESVFKWTSIALSVSAMVLVLAFADFGEGNEIAVFTAGIALMMSILWISEAIPLAATSLLPIILFPLFGVLSGKEVAQPYINSTILLFLGGFLIAVAMEKWNLHKRISLELISRFGKTPSQIIMGFMAASALISMWISNTATAVMLLPIGLAVVTKMEEDFKTESKNFAIALMLGIAYACSIGGIGTIIGTPPNLVFQRIYRMSFPNNPEITFNSWMVFAIPISLIMLLVAWFVLVKLVFPMDNKLKLDGRIIHNEKLKLGKISNAERKVLYVFLAAAVLWIFRKNIEIGGFVLPGWSNIFSNSKFIDDGTVAITMGFLLFIIPSGNKEKKIESLLNVRDIRKVPWEIILLFGGGFALAKGFISSKLSNIIASGLSGLHGFPIFLLILIICLAITFLTELTSNTATSQIILPILAAMSVELNIDPIVLMVPATISASMAFMMPVATPPNAIVFGSGRLKVKDMAKAGIILNIVGAFVISGFVYFFLA